jgi:uncharacterized membrane protein
MILTKVSRWISTMSLAALHTFRTLPYASGMNFPQGSPRLKPAASAKQNPASLSKGSDMNNTDIAVAVYDTHSQAETAVKTLQRAGFDMTRLSIVGKDYHSEEHVTGYFNTGDRAKFFGKLGAFWGGLAGMLFGSAFLFVPVVGHVIILGPLVATLVGGVQGAVFAGGAGALVGALTAIGIPKDSVLRYETALKADKFLVVLHGDAQEIKRAHELLTGAGLATLDHHSVSDPQATSSVPQAAPVSSGV